MASPGNYHTSHSYAPSAPTIPESENFDVGSPRTSTSPYGHPQPQSYQGVSQGYGGHQSYGGSHGYGGSQGYGGYSSLPPDVLRSFEAVDRDRSGYIDERELEQALSYQYQRFSIKTIRLLMFLFNNSSDPLRIGPQEFAALWSCLGQWRAIFERFDKDRSGKIDALELRDAMYSLGYAIPASVLGVLISKHDDGSGRTVQLNFDSFVECGMIIKGLTEKFKEKDRQRTGSATFSYDSFMSTALPFLVSYD